MWRGYFEFMLSLIQGATMALTGSTRASVCVNPSKVPYLCPKHLNNNINNKIILLIIIIIIDHHYFHRSTHIYSELITTTNNYFFQKRKAFAEDFFTPIPSSLHRASAAMAASQPLAAARR